MEKLLGKDTPLPLYDHEKPNDDNDEPPDAANDEESNDESSTATQMNFIPDESLNENENSSSDTGSTASSLEMDEDGTQTDSSASESEEVEDIVLPNMTELTNTIRDNELMDMQLPINLEVTTVADLGTKYIQAIFTLICSHNV